MEIINNRLKMKRFHKIFPSKNGIISMKKRTKLLIIILPILIVLGIGCFFIFRTKDIAEQLFGCPMDSYNGVIVYYNGFSNIT